LPARRRPRWRLKGKNSAWTFGKNSCEPGAKVHLSKINPSHKGEYESREQAAPDIAKNMQRMDKLQYLLYADDSQSLLVVLQALDAGGKDGTVRHLFSGMNPQGTHVTRPDSRSWSITNT
jgi:polyphosphate kinase 2 (PPK2 family)